MGIDDYDRIQFVSGWQKILIPLKAVLPKAKPPEQPLLRRSDFFCSCSSCFLINPSLKVIFPSHSSPTKKSIAHRSSSNYSTEQRLQKGKHSSQFLFLSTLDKNIGWFEAATTQQNKRLQKEKQFTIFIWANFQWWGGHEINHCRLFISFLSWTQRIIMMKMMMKMIKIM